MSAVNVRVISMIGSTRRIAMAEQLDVIGMPWEFFDALTTPPADIRYDPVLAQRVHGRTLQPGELGCFASHRALWNELAAQPGDPIMLVLEDDLVLDPMFFAELAAIARAAHPFGYLRLYAKVPAGLRVEAPFLDRFVARFSGRAYGTQAYFLTGAAARRLIRSVSKVVRPIDDEMDRYWAHGLPIRAVFPFPVMEVNRGSTIETKRRVGDPLPVADRLRWTTIKAVEKIRRHLANAAASLSP